MGVGKSLETIKHVNKIAMIIDEGLGTIPELQVSSESLEGPWASLREALSEASQDERPEVSRTPSLQKAGRGDAGRRQGRWEKR